ncbi:MAG: transposase zinc-binding domain-containing protein [bacterium]
MEYVSGIKIRDIFLDNGNWWKLFIINRHLIRISIIINVLKLLVCRTSFLGYHIFSCEKCGKILKVPHSCKSRFCSSCGKKATDNWIKKQYLFYKVYVLGIK